MRRSIKHINELIGILFNKNILTSYRDWEEFADSDDFIYNFDDPQEHQLMNNLIDIFGEEELIFKLEEEVLKVI